MRVRIDMEASFYPHVFNSFKFYQQQVSLSVYPEN